MMSTRILTSLFLLLFSSTLLAETASNFNELPVTVNTKDKESLQRGARFFMNYCSGCHSLKYMRYNAMGYALGLVTFDGQLNKDLLVNNLIFTRAKVQDPIEISMPEQDARQWFGTVPPDLTLEIRKRGLPWVYHFLHGFYVDKTRPFGSNNLVMPATAMPNVLAPLSGTRVAMHDGGDKNAPISHIVLVSNGQMTEQEFDANLSDLLGFLAYVAEPMKQERIRLGLVVIPFLAFFMWIVYRLKKVYWKKLKEKK